MWPHLLFPHCSARTAQYLAGASCCSVSELVKQRALSGSPPGRAFATQTNGGSVLHINCIVTGTNGELEPKAARQTGVFVKSMVIT